MHQQHHGALTLAAPWCTSISTSTCMASLSPPLASCNEGLRHVSPQVPGVRCHEVTDLCKVSFWLQKTYMVSKKKEDLRQGPEEKKWLHTQFSNQKWLRKSVFLKYFFITFLHKFGFLLITGVKQINACGCGSAKIGCTGCFTTLDTRKFG